MAVRNGEAVYYIKQLRSPDEERYQPGTYRVDGGREGVCTVPADSVEQVAEFLREDQSPNPQPGPAPW